MSRPKCIGLACDATQGFCDDCLRYWLNRPPKKQGKRGRHPSTIRSHAHPWFAVDRPIWGPSILYVVTALRDVPPERFKLEGCPFDEQLPPSTVPAAAPPSTPAMRYFVVSDYAGEQGHLSGGDPREHGEPFLSYSAAAAFVDEARKRGDLDYRDVRIEARPA
jgi:hypothetical protein